MVKLEPISRRGSSGGMEWLKIGNCGCEASNSEPEIWWKWLFPWNLRDFPENLDGHWKHVLDSGKWASHTPPIHTLLRAGQTSVSKQVFANELWQKSVWQPPPPVKPDHCKGAAESWSWQAAQQGHFKPSMRHVAGPLSWGQLNCDT